MIILKKSRIFKREKDARDQQETASEEGQGPALGGGGRRSDGARPLYQADAHATALEGAAAKLGNASRIAMSSTLHVGVITGALKSSVIPGGGKQQKKAIAGGGGKPKGGGGKPKGGGDSPPTTTRKRGKGGGDQKPIKGTN